MHTEIHGAVIYSIWYPNSCILDMQIQEDTEIFMDEFHTAGIISTTERMKKIEAIYLPVSANPHTVIGQVEPIHPFCQDVI